MILSYQERTELVRLSNDANWGRWVTLPPELFRKLVALAQQADARNTAAMAPTITFVAAKSAGEAEA